MSVFTLGIITPLVWRHKLLLLFSGLLMDLFLKYVPSFGTRILFVYSAVFSLIAFIPMFFVKHGESVHLDGEKVELHIEAD